MITGTIGDFRYELEFVNQKLVITIFGNDISYISEQSTIIDEKGTLIYGIFQDHFRNNTSINWIIKIVRIENKDYINISNSVLYNLFDILIKKTSTDKTDDNSDKVTINDDGIDLEKISSIFESIQSRYNNSIADYTKSIEDKKKHLIDTEKQLQEDIKKKMEEINDIKKKWKKKLMI